MAIPSIFHRHGYTHRMIKREANIALYSLTKFGRMTYEVCKVRTAASDNALTGRKAGEEYLPSTSEWGIYGWTFQTLPAAERQFKALVYLTPTI